MEPIEVVVVTCDRPRALERCVRSIVELEGSGPAIRHITVVDSSRSETSVLENRRILASRGELGIGVSYAGVVAAGRIAELVRPHVSSLSDFRRAIVPREIGAARNLGLLLTAGRRVVMTDDDMVWRTWAIGPLKEGVALAGHREMFRSAFFRNRDDVFRTLEWCHRSVLAAHAKLLGRRVADIVRLDKPIWFRTPCPTTLRAAGPQSRATVQLTFGGIAGDSGVFCPYQRLFGDSGVVDDITRDSEVYRLAMQSREVRRHVDAYTVAHEAVCMMGVVGIDNTRPLLPFSPEGTNEDGLFGLLRRLLYPNDVVGVVPIGVCHESDRPAAYADHRPSAHQVRPNDAIGALIAALAGPPGELRSTDVLAQLLLDWGTARPKTAMCLLRDALRAADNRRVGIIRGHLSARTGVEQWRRDASDYSEMLGRPSGDLQRLWPDVPIGRMAKVVALQRYVQRYAVLLREWNGVWGHWVRGASSFLDELEGQL